MAFLELIDIYKSWPNFILEASLSLEKGKILSIAGPSGSGKSTLLSICAGLEQADSGKVLLDGVDISKLEPGERGIAMVFQDYALFPHLDVEGNIAYGLKYKGFSRKDIKTRVKGLLKSMNLEGFEKRKVNMLSGGERQRTALARSLATEPSIILFDEALSSLDTQLRKQLRSDIIKEQKRLGFTAIYVSHDLEEAMAVGDQMAIMKDGKILQCSEPQNLWSDPADIQIAQFLGSGPCLKIINIEKTGSYYYIKTKAGLFILESAQNIAKNISSIHNHNCYIYFERSAAVPVNDAHKKENVLDSWFDASCIKKDYAGDTIDCLMESGDERFVLRFPTASAPDSGSSNRYSVKNIKLLPEKNQ